MCGTAEAYLFEIAAGDLADSVRGDESQVSGAEKRDHEVLRKHVCRLLGSNRKGLPSPFETLSTEVDGLILRRLLESERFTKYLTY